MATSYHIGQRVSFESALCTVRYIGPVESTQKEWLGVEWDTSSRGKHDGQHNGVRYFECRSKSAVAASFIRSTRAADPVRTFVQAVHAKYASEMLTTSDSQRPPRLIEISGKVVEEVGFDKIRKQLARLHELKIVLLEGMHIKSAINSSHSIRETCPKIVELDLSRNLFENLTEIVEICAELDCLRCLKIAGNRLPSITAELCSSATLAFDGISELGVDETLWSWEEMLHFVHTFPSLTKLTACANELSSLQLPIQPIVLPSGLTSITLEYNRFKSISDISALASITSLEKVCLKGNEIETIGHMSTLQTRFGERLHYIDLSFNKVATWEFVDELSVVFPGLTALRLSQNPIYSSEESQENKAVSEENFMLTLARIKNLKALNFSNITPAERTNAEMFYLSRITRALSEVPKSEEKDVLKQHKRYLELCEIYGAPEIVRASAKTINPNFLEARLIKFTFYLSHRSKDAREAAVIRTQEIPRSFDVYQVKGIVARLFELNPLKVRLIWETGEWDPVAGYEDIDNLSEDESDSDTESKMESSKRGQIKGQWVRRELELEDGTRQIGFLVDGADAKVRVELR